MEQETMLKEILNAFELYSEKMDKKLDDLESRIDEKLGNLKTDLDSKMDTGFASVNERLERLGIKQEGMRVELTESNETIDFLLTKTAQQNKSASARLATYELD